MVSEVKKIHCNRCNLETNHELLATHDCIYYTCIDWYEKSRYGFWVCRGCDTASLENKYTDAQMESHASNKRYSFIYSPERNNKPLQVAKKFQHVDKKLKLVYLEIIQAHNQELEIITTIGIRALLEGICVKEGIDDESAYGLSEKIKKLETGKKVPKDIIEGLNNLNFIGNDAAHRLKASDRSHIMYSIDLLEALLNHLYEAKYDLQNKAKRVTDAAPINK